MSIQEICMSSSQEILSTGLQKHTSNLPITCNKIGKVYSAEHTDIPKALFIHATQVILALMLAKTIVVPWVILVLM
jgi:hypothetical protein